MSLCSIIRVKSFPSGWSGQNEDICPSIKKSMVKVTRHSKFDIPTTFPRFSISLVSIVSGKERKRRKKERDQQSVENDND